MAVVHVVLFHFKASLTQEQILHTCNEMLKLEHTCRHPRTGEKYIKSYSGGKNISPEGLSKGATHGFVFEFENVEDRDYYLNDDPAHIKFKELVLPQVDDATVLDFSPGSH